MSSTLTTVPRKLPDSKPTSLESALSAISDLQDAMRLQPAVQIKRFEVLAGDYPLFITTRVRNILGVSVVGAWFASTDPGVATYAGAIHWQLGTTPGELRINGIQDLTAGTKYTVAVRIEGDR